MLKGFPLPFNQNNQKGIRIDVAENGFVIYLRKADNGEDIRIAASTQAMWYILTSYLKEPIPVTVETNDQGL